jgi:hypothetical protein
MGRPQHRRGDEQLLGALAAGHAVEEAARAAGISQRTAYRRLADPAFQRRLAGARDNLVTEALGELVASAAAAVGTLRTLLDARDDRIKLGAAKTLLEQLLRIRETVALAERVAALERRQEQARRRR